MSILGNDLLLGSGDEGYNLTRSLRTRASASAYLNRTFASTGNRQIWTWSGWVKRGALSSGALFGADGSNYMFMYFSPDSLDCGEVVGSQQWRRVTTQVFRDPSAWYHIVLAFDSTQATAGNRVKLYVNGSQVTAFSTSADPSLNYNSVVNTTIAHSIGSFAAPTRQAYLDGYLTEVNFIDGQALTPSSFGSTNTLTGVWQPARYTGSYGTNGFYLPFTDNSALTTSSNVGLGKDFSGNGNYWTTNNISITSGVTYDSMTDVPTLTSATAANFATLNPLRPTGSGGFSNGNLTGTGETGTSRGLTSTIVLPYTGKWYAEVTPSSNIYNWFGVTAVDFLAAEINSVGQQSVLYYALNGNKFVNGTGSAYGASYTTETIGIAFDGAAGTIAFYKANVSQGAITLPSSTAQYVFVQGNANLTAISANWNFGQQPWTYTPPTGFVALNTFNLPTSTIVKGNTVMDATTYTGTLLSNAITNAAAFKPDLVWLKSRSAATGHEWTDSVRGVTKSLSSNSTAAEATDVQGLTAFNTNGFTVGTNTDYNNLAATYVAWQWQAGKGSSSSNTSGTITSTVSVNASAGFSVVTFTGNGLTSSGQTIGHGLGVTPAFIVTKKLSSGTTDFGWSTYHVSNGTANIWLNLTNAKNPGNWNTAPTSSVFSPPDLLYGNESGQTYVAYCWTPIAGYSAFGSYTGNGSTDGPFVYTGFRPRFILYKASNNVTNWVMLDTARDPYNVAGNYLFPNSSSAEANAPIFDIVSNGFKVRTAGGGTNGSGDNIVYMAFAENPTKFALAR
jgi:hypothetical protein